MPNLRSFPTRRSSDLEALNMPLETLTAATTKTLRKDQAVIVYCADYQCDLSARAAWRLESMGFQEVYRYTPGKADWLDRKSTRLNSSHITIAYAVFCL